MKPNKMRVLIGKPDARTIVLALLWLSASHIGRTQIGSGAPQASARAQVESKVDDQTAGPKDYIGQALDQDGAVLSKVQADPLFHSDALRLALRPFDLAMSDLLKAEGLSFAATYTVVNQYATVTPNSVRHNSATGRFDLAGGWQAYDHSGSAGSFSMLVRSGTNIGVSEQFNLSDAIGSGLVLNCLPGGGPQEPITLNVLYYRQDFYQKKFAFYIGKIHPNEFISLSLYNNDERTQFLNAENDGNLTIPRMALTRVAPRWNIKPQSTFTFML